MLLDYTGQDIFIQTFALFENTLQYTAELLSLEYDLYVLASLDQLSIGFQQIIINIIQHNSTNLTISLKCFEYLMKICSYWSLPYDEKLHAQLGSLSATAKMKETDSNNFKPESKSFNVIHFLSNVLVQITFYPSLKRYNFHQQLQQSIELISSQCIKYQFHNNLSSRFKHYHQLTIDIFIPSILSIFMYYSFDTVYMLNMCYLLVAISSSSSSGLQATDQALGLGLGSTNDDDDDDDAISQISQQQGNPNEAQELVEGGQKEKKKKKKEN